MNGILMKNFMTVCIFIFTHEVYTLLLLLCDDMNNWKYIHGLCYDQ